MNQTIEKRKILIPFIILGARPTSTPSPKRDQLVHFGDANITGDHPKRGLAFMGRSFLKTVENVAEKLAL